MSKSHSKKNLSVPTLSLSWCIWVIPIKQATLFNFVQLVDLLNFTCILRRTCSTCKTICVAQGTLIFGPFRKTVICFFFAFFLTCHSLRVWTGHVLKVLFQCPQAPWQKRRCSTNCFRRGLVQGFSEVCWLGNISSPQIGPGFVWEGLTAAYWDRRIEYIEIYRIWI